jgi:thymidylate kinase
MNAAEFIDAAVAARVLVYGSLPPEGRDLDLLVREPERIAIDACLAEAGFSRQGNEWARFASCSVEAVETASAASLDLPPDELAALFDEALEIDGLRKVVRPCPHHDLLILARRVSRGSGMLDLKRRARLEQTLAEDPDAWKRARERAGGWRSRVALDALEEVWRTGIPIPAAQRAAARRELRRAHAGAETGVVARLSAAVRRLPRPHQGAVVALSGLDGAGKSSQAAALQETLERLGYDAIVVRTRITWDDSLWAVATPIKQLLTPPLRLLTSSRSPRPSRRPPPARERPLAHENDDGSEERAHEGQATYDPVTSVRESSSLLTSLWTLMITLANASSQWKLMRRQLLRGGIVICDRYTLDSIVELRYSYGREPSFRAARAALRRLYPTPVHAYFLDVSPSAALERKGEWGLRWLTEHRDLYLEECERFGVRLLDGERPRDELCTEIASEVWNSGGI